MNEIIRAIINRHAKVFEKAVSEEVASHLGPNQHVRIDIAAAIKIIELPKSTVKVKVYERTQPTGRKYQWGYREKTVALDPATPEEVTAILPVFKSVPKSLRTVVEQVEKNKNELLPTTGIAPQTVERINQILRTEGLLIGLKSDHSARVWPDRKIQFYRLAPPLYQSTS